MFGENERFEFLVGCGSYFVGWVAEPVVDGVPLEWVPWVYIAELEE